MTPQEVFPLRYSPDQALRLRAHGRAKVSACRRSDFQPLGSVGRAEDSTPAAGDPPQLDARTKMVEHLQPPEKPENEEMVGANREISQTS